MEVILWVFLIIFGWFFSGYLAVIIASLFNRWGILNNENITPNKENFHIIVSFGLIPLFTIVFFGIVSLFIIIFDLGGSLIKSLGMLIVFIYEKLRDFALNLSDRKEKE